MNKQQKTVTVTVGDRREQVGAKIAPLVKELWTAGIDTAFQFEDAGRECNNRELDGWVMLSFVSLFDLLAFVGFIARSKSCSSGMFGRVFSVKTNSGDGPIPGQWMFDPIKHGERGGGYHYVNTLLFFPQSDLASANECIREHNAGLDGRAGMFPSQARVH